MLVFSFIHGACVCVLYDSYQMGGQLVEIATAWGVCEEGLS